MKPFDDSIPEETEPGHQALLEQLPHLYNQPTPLTPAEMEQALSKARESLLHFQATVANENAPVPPQPLESNGTALSRQLAPSLRPHRTKRLFSVLNKFIAVLVVGAIIGTALLLFSHSPQLGGTPDMPADMSVTTYTTASGLEMSLGITRGPYFLSEMIAVTLSLRNGTSTSYIVGYPFVTSPCGYDPGVYMAGGNPPNYVLSIETDHSCPGGYYNSVTLKTDQSITVHKYLLLTSSGHVTLATEVAFLKSSIDNGFKVLSPITNPLDGHLPSAHISVSSKVPADRHIAFRIVGSQVTVIVPQQVHSPVLYLYGISCSDPQGLGQNLQPQGTMSTGNYGWEPLPTKTVNEPGCGTNSLWSFAFGVPGYAIVTGQHGDS